MQRNDLHLLEATILEHKLHQLGRQRMAVRRVEIKVVAADDDVIRVRCFENHDAAGTKHTHDVVQQRYQRIEREMLDDVKSGDGAGAGIAEALQIREHILLDNVETECLTLFNLETVVIDSSRLDSVFRE